MSIGGELEAEEICNVFRKAINGDVKIFLSDTRNPWAAANGNVTVNIDEYSIVIFSDCGALDYVDSVKSVDGRMADYDYWTALSSAKKEPVELLSFSEQKKLEELLHEAT
jgi:hypothetical protein